MVDKFGWLVKEDDCLPIPADNKVPEASRKIAPMADGSPKEDHCTLVLKVDEVEGIADNNGGRNARMSEEVQRTRSESPMDVAFLVSNVSLRSKHLKTILAR